MIFEAQKQRFLGMQLGQKVAVGLLVAMALSAMVGLGLYLVQSPVITAGDYNPFASKQEYDAFYKAHPLLKKSAPDDKQFHYQASVSVNKQAVYRIYLLTPPLKSAGPEAQQQYIALLKSFQQQASDWFKSQGEDLSKVYVQWIPNPDTVLTTPTPRDHPLPNKSTEKK